jgi:hypothetical protein
MRVYNSLITKPLTSMINKINYKLYTRVIQGYLINNLIIYLREKR